MSTDKQWVRADVTYQGKGTYTYKKRFRANRTEKVEDPQISRYLKDFPFFSVHDVFEGDEKPKKKVTKKVTKKVVSSAKKTRTKRVKARGE